ncbi:hypothetical protein Acr_03g0020080 [Actinidia rufa]|uniref:Uncharacterized protein n=1 Tax=Actinidia rufa TaxID=165716 RepID=A0A7J0EFI0_9ERIC|nr:hypothetical protein Acr_03g0020080 [Actinidia rufa]
MSSDFGVLDKSASSSHNITQPQLVNHIRVKSIMMRLRMCQMSITLCRHILVVAAQGSAVAHSCDIKKESCYRWCGRANYYWTAFKISDI